MPPNSALKPILFASVFTVLAMFPCYGQELLSYGSPGFWCARILEKKQEGLGEIHARIGADLKSTITATQVSVVAEEPSPRELKAVRDYQSPHLLLLEPLPQHPDKENENRTARDYARFVKRVYGNEFLFLGQFMNRSVPVFDGVVLAPDDHHGVINVSLKYASVRLPSAKLETLIESMQGRLNYDSEIYNLIYPAEWFMKVNHMSSLLKVRNKPEYPERLVRTKLLMNLFGLYSGKAPFGRKLVTVVDVRNHGYPFEFFRDPKVQKALMQLVRAKAEQGLTLTLLWDAEHVVEVRGGAVKLYEAGR